MKYIRTKDGTIELNREEIEREITKQADTIEELCDAVVVKYNYESLPKIIETLQNNKSQMINALKDNKDVQWINLAIWTDKGLVYVAKINDKGELELL